MVTMRDVAKEADVSVATVSAVINQNKFVSEDLTKRVKDTIKKLDYTPNKMAQGLAKQKTYVIAYLVPSISNPIFAKTVEGIEEIVSQYDYTVTVVNTNFKVEKYLHDIRRLIKRVDGIAISAGHHPEINKILRELDNKKIPSVVIHSPTNLKDVPAVLADNIGGVENAINYLIEKGHEKIGFLGVKDSVSCSKRWQGYKMALSEHKIRYDDDLVFLVDRYSREEGENGCNKLLERRSDITAVLACSDTLAIGVVEALHEKKVHIPEDFSVIGFDGTLAKYSWPTLTTINLPCKKMGKEAAKMLLKQNKEDVQEQENKDDDIKKIIKPELIIRNSTF